MVIFVGDPYPHHSASSGYHQLTAQFPDAPCLSAAALERGALHWHRRPRFPDAARPGARAIWHVLHADLSAAVPAIRRIASNARIIVTLHQPAWFVEALRHDRRLATAQADLVLLVSQRQLCDLDPVTARRAQVMLHGVTTAAWAASGPGPAPAPADWLVVGEHLRDWPFIREVCRATTPLGVRWTFVVPARQARDLSDIAGVRIATDRSERELAALYRSARGLLLALVDATANNTLLEALAAGCPIVANRIPGIEDYAGDVPLYFRSGSVGDCVAAIQRVSNLTADERAAYIARGQARARALDWSEIAVRYRDLVRTLEIDA